MNVGNQEDLDPAVSLGLGVNVTVHPGNDLQPLQRLVCGPSVGES